MKKVEVGQAIGILANVGVVLGLILLAIEIEQANDQAGASAYQARIDQIDLANQQFALSTDLPPIYVKLEQTGLNSLDAEELLRVRAWELARSQRMAGQYYQFQQGYLDEAAYRAMMGAAEDWIDLWEILGLGVANQEFFQAVRAQRE